MSKRYAIWNRQDLIYTPIGEEITAEQWLEQYKFLKPATSVPIVAAGLINGAFCGELSQMKQQYEDMGADFSECITNEDILNAIEAFEDKMNTPSNEPTAEERIAAALEYQTMASLPDEEESEETV